MKIAYTGINVAEGKLKYNDRIFTGLADKFKPAKLSPYYFEFIPDDYKAADAIAIKNDRILDLLILDMEKTENRIFRVEEKAEKTVLLMCLAHLEEQKPICDLALNSDERAVVNALGLLSAKPTVVYDDSDVDADIVCRGVMEKTGVMFFYTAGKQEVHSWLVEKGSDAVTCAGKIHSDLARGFIKADLVSYDDLVKVHSIQDAHAKNFAKLVDRDYIIPENSIIEIRFSVFMQ